MCLTSEQIRLLVSVALDGDVSDVASAGGVA
jgi:hypothetical protein